MTNQLLQGIIVGNKKVFEQFFHMYYGRLLRYACLLLKDSEVAKDIVQDAFINVWKQRNTLRADLSLNALIYKFVRNRCVNYLRDSGTYLKHKEMWGKEELQHVTHYDFIGSEEPTVEELLVEELNKAVECLPDKCKQVFILNKIDGLKQADIAKQLSMSVKMVEKHIATAKDKLKKQLLKKFPTYGILICYLLNM